MGRRFIAGNGDPTPRHHVEPDDHTRPTWEVSFAAKGKWHIIQGWPALVIKLGTLAVMVACGVGVGWLLWGVGR